MPGYYRMRVSKAGFASIERPFDPVGLSLSPSAGHVDLTLQHRELAPPDMVWVDAAVAVCFYDIRADHASGGSWLLAGRG
jgi:hypothetical protein